MKKYCLALLACGLLCALPGQSQAPYSRVEIFLAGKNMTDLAALGIETDHGFLRPGYSFTTDLAAGEIQRVKDAGFSVRSVIDDVQAWYADASRALPVDERGIGCAGSSVPAYATPVNYTYGTMGSYHTYQQMLDVLDSMAVKFPNLITLRQVVSDSLLTHEGRPLWYVKVSDSPNLDEEEPEVLYTALHHAREPNGMSQMLFYLWYLLENYPADTAIQYIVNESELFFIPCVNPDGYIFNETTHPNGGGLWRKNRRDNQNGTFGVDLNRNYGYAWGFDDLGSSPDPATDTYRGPAGFSEPETGMMRDFCQQHTFENVLNYHTYSNLLVYPWSYSNSVADSALVYLGRLFTRENHYLAGTTLQTLNYPVNGSSDDWMYGVRGSLSMTPEVGKSGFWPPPAEIDGLNKQNLWANEAAALSTLVYGEAHDRSSPFITAPTASLAFNLTRYGARDGALTVSLIPLSDNVLAVSAPLIFSIDRFASVTDSFTLTVAPSAVAGETIELLLQTDNGFFTRADTLRKTYGGPEVPLFTENASSLDVWEGTWDVTTEHFVSAPSSFTDSPLGPYENSTYSFLELTTPVFIPPSALNPHLRFWARWQLEEDFDYVQILATGSDGSFVELCGQYTEEGVGMAQPEGLPLYDGAQLEWVEECIDLSPYPGLSVRLTFFLVSDEGLAYDGFYFDDLEIAYLDTLTTGYVALPLTDFRLLPNQPNPAADYTLIRWESNSGKDEPAELAVYNTLGQPVRRQAIHSSDRGTLRLDTRGWAPGIYTYIVQLASGRRVAERLLIR